VDHTYATSGWQYASLTVTDNSGLTATEYVSIEVVTDGVNTTATGDQAPVYGTIISGSYLSTMTQDDNAEILKEALVSSSSRLEQSWTLSVAPGYNQTFYLDAYHSANTEGDNFVFEYSRDRLSWTPMITVTKTTDNDVLQSYAFPQDVTGLLYVRVRDLDRTTGRTKLDTVGIDQMYVASKASSGRAGEVAQGAAALVGGMLSVSKSSGGLLLAWGPSCVSTDTDFAAYEGPIGDFRAHVPAMCSTGGATSATISPSAGNTYYLVAPTDHYYEGRYGMSSSGVETPPGPTRCYPAALVTGCP
jgi:hypothetical protein